LSAPAARPGSESVEGTFSGWDGTRLRSLSWPVDSARARVVVVHGLGEHAGRYEILAGALAARGYSVFCYDQRGHGKSEGARGHVSDFDFFVNDLAVAVSLAESSLPGAGDPFLFGHSMGGLVVIRHLQTTRARVPGAILSAPWLGTGAPIPRWKRGFAAVLRKVAPSFPIRTSLDVEALTSDPELQRAYLEDRLVGHAISVGLYDAVRDAQARALASGPTSTPTLLLVPLEDRVADARLALEWARAKDDVEVLRLSGMRHEPHNERRRAEVMAALADWLDARTRGTPGG
jgi:alpha-beta hydrolase superfamily lysophospholipase